MFSCPAEQRGTALLLLSLPSVSQKSALRREQTSASLVPPPPHLSLGLPGELWARAPRVAALSTAVEVVTANLPIWINNLVNNFLCALRSAAEYRV